MVRQDRLSRSSKSRFGYFDMVFSLAAQRRSVFEKISDAEDVHRPRSTTAGGKSRQGQAHSGGGPHLLFVSSFPQSRSTRETASQSSRRGLHQRRQRQSHDYQRSASSQRDQSVR